MSVGVSIKEQPRRGKWDMTPLTGEQIKRTITSQTSLGLNFVGNTWVKVSTQLNIYNKYLVVSDIVMWTDPTSIFFLLILFL